MELSDDAIPGGGDGGGDGGGGAGAPSAAGGRRTSMDGPRGFRRPARGLHRTQPANRANRAHGSGAVLLAVFMAALAACGPTGGEPETSEGTGGEAQPSEEARMSAERVHPAFAISPDELTELVSNTPESAREAISERPEYFLELVKELLEVPPQRLRLVDKEHSLPEDAEPQDLVVLDDYSEVLTLNRAGLELRSVVLPDLIAMSEAARRNSTLLPVSSTYRSYEYQKNLYQRHVDELGEEQASRVSARPGTSQHQLGTTIDFGSITPDFAKTQAGRWLAANAADFGFSMSYPDGYEELTGYSYEPWHFRWIGRTATEMETAFFSGIQQHMLEFWNEHSETLRSKVE